MSLFFINRPIKQGRPPSMFYFIRTLFRAHAHAILPSVSLSPVFAVSALVSFVVPFFPSLSRIPAFRPLRSSLGLSRSVSRREASPSVARRRTLCRAGPVAVLFLLFYSTFSREGGILLLPGRATPVFSGQ